MNWPWTKIPAPLALPSKLFPNEGVENEYTWEDWEEENSKAFPIRWFFQRTIPYLWSKFTRPFKRFAYWFRTHTYNRYHIIDLRNADGEYKWGWIDRREAILLACFKLLVDFVEKESPELKNPPIRRTDCTDDYSIKSDEHWFTLNSEIHLLYKWWTEERLKDLELYYSDLRCDLPYDYLDNKNDEMLIRLMKIRQALWT